MLTYLPAGTIKRVHVDRRIIAQNRVNGTNKPAITVQTSKGALKARRVSVLGHSEFVQSEKPLKCGARVWVETYSALEVIR